jgi:hypothetical protein
MNSRARCLKLVDNYRAAGTHVYIQGWFRDPPLCRSSTLTRALDMTYAP